MPTQEQLDAALLAAQQAQAIADQEQAEADAAQAVADQEQADVVAAQATLDSAQATLDALNAAANPPPVPTAQEIQAATQAVQDAQTALAIEQAEAEDAQATSNEETSEAAAAQSDADEAQAEYDALVESDPVCDPVSVEFLYGPGSIVYAIVDPYGVRKGVVKQAELRETFSTFATAPQYYVLLRGDAGVTLFEQDRLYCDVDDALAVERERILAS